mmetsp:Transcript_33492/g.77835  ORF Transcript_33492/g.77835 Transcript_33492/m.77835 type:complete len:208 (-) Transcript_33492:56-679(-)|eukprot:CAMPEP_0171057766 /NCGR_PEP_ID=MMETSP0766_2-20121228/2030_1 /TAXON_ID=439317 /ORGANISM="Gambierdiscus australes, Strain CAWD 149" /LENGTH=207 /DNA_ID=CAMNT_0011512949 /DNA_START=52 /DNA_END=675 /DNA_ORIENTATION=+
MGNTIVCDDASSSDGPGWQRLAVHEVRLAATEILNVAGMSGYHTSVIVDDREYFFDSAGVMTAAPLASHAGGQGKRPDWKTEVLEIGRSTCSGSALVEALVPYFQKGTYDIFFKNCNTFSDVALYFLTRTRLPSSHSRLERFVAATSPLSTGALNKIFKAFVEKKTGQPCTEDIYVQNPEAAGFSAEAVITGLRDGFNSDSEGSDSD